MHNSTPKDNRREVALFNADSPVSFDRLLPEGFAHQVRALWANEEYRPMLAMSEWDLKAALRRKDFSPGPRDINLKYQFWQEFDSVGAMQSPKMNMAKVLRKTIPKESFYRDYITDPRCLVYMLTPPAELLTAMKIALDLSLERFIEVLKMPVTNPNGTLNSKTVLMMMKIQERLAEQVEILSGRTPKVGRPKGSGVKSENEEAPPGEPMSEEEQLNQLLVERDLLQREKDQSKIGFEKEPDLSVV